MAVGKIGGVFAFLASGATVVASYVEGVPVALIIIRTLAVGVLAMAFVAGVRAAFGRLRFEPVPPLPTEEPRTAEVDGGAPAKLHDVEADRDRAIAEGDRLREELSAERSRRPDPAVTLSIGDQAPRDVRAVVRALVRNSGGAGGTFKGVIRRRDGKAMPDWFPGDTKMEPDQRVVRLTWGRGGEKAFLAPGEDEATTLFLFLQRDEVYKYWAPTGRMTDLQAGQKLVLDLEVVITADEGPLTVWTAFVTLNRSGFRVAAPDGTTLLAPDSEAPPPEPDGKRDPER